MFALLYCIYIYFIDAFVVVLLYGYAVYLVCLRFVRCAFVSAVVYCLLVWVVSDFVGCCGI